MFQASFFDDSLYEEIMSSKKSKRKKDCFTCGLYLKCKSPKMQTTGEGKKQILIIAEAPGRQEDEKGIQLIGDAGQFLREILKKNGYDLDADFWKTNAIICRPPNNAKPTNEQIECCKVNVIKTIEKLKPVGVILFGEVAFKSLIGNKVQKHLPKYQFNNFIGCCIPDQVFKMWIGVMYHPSFVIRSENNTDYNGRVKDPSVRLLWERNLIDILDTMQRPFYNHNYQSDVLITQDKHQAISWINNAIDNVDIIGMDYETTGLKPHRKGHEIKCMSFSDGVFAYAFPNFQDDEFQEAWKMLLKSDKEIRAHNLRFESMWTQTNLGYSLIGKFHDTMLAAHCFNNRMRTGLKFWVYILFGILGYDVQIEKYIKNKRKGENEKSNNSFNEIEKADVNELLLYNGLDSLLCYKLADHFESELKPFQKEGLNLLIEGNKYLLDIQQKGIRINTELLQKDKKEIGDKLKQLNDRIMQSKEVKDKWKAVKKFSFTSNKDLPKLLFDILKIPKPTKKEELTATGQPSLDKKNLPRYEKKYPFIKSILEWKKWQRTLACVDQFEREIVDGLVHPDFNLNTARTFRPSTSNPNFANIAKRDEETKTLMRSLVISQEGCRIVELDFKQLEVCLDGQTLIETISGKMTLKEILEMYNNKDVFVYCYDFDKKRIGISKVVGGGLTGRNKKTIEILLDNEKSIICTPSHEFLMRDGFYKRADHLKIDDSLMPFYASVHKTPSGCNYKKIRLNNGSKILAHNLIAEDVFNVDLKKKNLIVHHIDGNGMNNAIENLKVVSRKEHMRIHSLQGWRNKKKERNFEYQKSEEAKKKRKEGYIKWLTSLTNEERKILNKRISENRGDYTGKKNPMYGRKQSEETKRKISETKKSQNLTGEKCYYYGRKISEETKKKISIAHRRENLSKETREKMSKFQKGKVITDEVRLKISASLKGRIFSEEERRKLSIAGKKRWRKWRKQRDKSKKEKNNHKVLCVRQAKNRDVYCITVENSHNFVVSAGVIVKNCINSCINKDPVLLEYVRQEKSHLHTDQAVILFMKEKGLIDSKEAFTCKNSFVFATFYGSYYKQTAPELWKNMPDYTKQHLKECGIQKYYDFEEHVRIVEKALWEKFHVYAEWQRKIYKEYLKNGYIDTLTGFRLHGWMKKNDVICYPAQGCAFHCLLQLIIWISKELKKRKIKRSFLINQVYDSTLWNMHPDDEEEIDAMYYDFTANILPQIYDWLIVPLRVEKERSEINGSWAKMENCGILKGKV